MTGGAADGGIGLDQVPVGGRAVVKVVGGKAALRQRLLEMGLTEGTDVEVVRLAPLGDPMEIRVRGYYLTLRKGDAKDVRVLVVAP